MNVNDSQIQEKNIRAARSNIIASLVVPASYKALDKFEASFAQKSVDNQHSVTHKLKSKLNLKTFGVDEVVEITVAVTVSGSKVLDGSRSRSFKTVNDSINDLAQYTRRNVASARVDEEHNEFQLLFTVAATEKKLPG